MGRVCAAMPIQLFMAVIMGDLRYWTEHGTPEANEVLTGRLYDLLQVMARCPLSLSLGISAPI